MKTVRNPSRAPGKRVPKPSRRERRVIPALEWAEDAAGHSARATILGNRSVLVENFSAIVRFSEDCVRLDTARGAMVVCGRDLSLCEVRPGALIVRGEIRRVELPCPGGAVPDEG